jgi:transketolase
MLASIPGVDLYSLSSSDEAEALLTHVIEKFAEDRISGKKPNSSVFFLGRENFPKTFKTPASKFDYKPAEVQVLFSDLSKEKNVLLVTTGSLVGEALLAADKLKSQKVGAIVVNQNTLNILDSTKYAELLAKTEGRVITIEDHQVLLGLGSFIAHQLSLSSVRFKMKSLGVKGKFGQSAYNAIELYRKHGVDSDSIVRAALEI